MRSRVVETLIPRNELGPETVGPGRWGEYEAEVAEPVKGGVLSPRRDCDPATDLGRRWCSPGSGRCGRAHEEVHRVTRTERLEDPEARRRPLFEPFIGWPEDTCVLMSGGALIAL